MADDYVKRANWLELLFDLIFVYAVSKATHILAHTHNGHIEIKQYFIFVLVMVPIWWAWTGHTLFATRFDTEDVGQRLLTLIQMLATVFWASFINSDFDPNYLGYLLFYVVIRLLLVMMYWRAATINPAAKPIAKRLSTGFLVGLSVAMLSLLFDPPIRYIVLYAGITIEIITPLLSRSILKKIPVKSHHLPERYGLLTIILLGESVLMLASKLTEAQWTSPVVVSAITGFALMAALWWLYFDLVENYTLGRDLGTGQHIIYGHLFVYTGFSAIAVLIGYTIAPEVTPVDYWMLSTFGFISLVIGLLIIFGIQAMISKKRLFLYFTILATTCVSLICGVYSIGLTA